MKTMKAKLSALIRWDWKATMVN